MIRFIAPLVVFLGLAGLLWKGLGLNPRDLPSQLINQAAPAFALETVADPSSQITNNSLAGKVWVLNVWASWCVACLQEHAVISQLAKEVPVVGLNYKDKREEALAWLGQHGNPYLVSGYDNEGNTGIDYGVYGVPETFIIDQRNQIRYKHTGPVSEQDMLDKLLPVVAELSGQ